MAYIAMELIETTVFMAEIDRLLSIEELAALHLALALHPERGPVMPGSGGCRKLRWAVAGGGKRGGLRVIYYWDRRAHVVYLLDVFRKSDRATLSSRQLDALRRTVKEALHED